MQVLKLFRAIEKQYEKAEEETWHFEYTCSSKELYELDKLLKEVPQEYWIQ